ncbi:MAG: T9SS C-terminal target domain-containing protein [Calditrichaeota bacterium]|nr:MAG: T9SS C-terminal target domain-containing protein [Calditrichota bacterium]
MKVLTKAIFILVFVNSVYGEMPQTIQELEEAKTKSEYFVKEYQSGNITYCLLGLKSKSERDESTLYRTPIGDSFELNWTVLPFNEPVDDVLVEGNNLLIKSKNKVFQSGNGGMGFRESSLAFSESSLSVLENQPLNLKKKTTNQISCLPTIAPSVWDTLLMDTSQVFLTSNIPQGGLAFMHGRVAVGDSGFVHVASVREDRLLKYHRSTDYGATFETAVVLEDTIGKVYSIQATGDNVYVYAVSSASWAPVYKYYLFSSSDRGATWNPPIEQPFTTRENIISRSDTVYHFVETGAGGSLYEAESFDMGESFSLYQEIDTLWAAIQDPSIATAGNSIIYFRTGNGGQTSGTFVYRSFDLGNTWFPPMDLSYNCSFWNYQNPSIRFDGSTFHTTQGFGYSLHTKSVDYGNTFNPYTTLCIVDSNCAVSEQQKLASFDGNVFPLINDNINFGITDRLITRFSRDNGNTWSKILYISDYNNGWVGVSPWYSIAADDSLIYVTYSRSKETISSDWDFELVFKRGFYKYPLYSSVNTLDLGLVDSSLKIITNLPVANKGVIPLYINQIDLPTEITLLDDSTTTPLAFPLIIQPDSVFNFQFEFLSEVVGSYSDSIKIHTNQQVEPLRTIFVSGEILAVGVSEEENTITTFKLSQNYPNPFNPTTVINYELGIANYEKATLTIYNILGKKVKEWKLKSNSGEVVWNGTDNFGNSVSSGVYFYKLKSEKQSETKKMLLIR